MPRKPVRRPILPRPLALPVGLVPDQANNFVFSKTLNRVFREQLADGELAPLEARTLSLRISDVGKTFSVRLRDGRFHPAAGRLKSDLTIEGTLYDFMLLAAGREDPDTLFFQRHLSIQGDTGLGVFLKNFLGGIDPRELPMPAFFHTALERGLDLYQRLA